MKRGRKVQVPEYPPSKVFYFSKKRYESGIITKKIEGNDIYIYAIEKTICDIIRYRYKIGLDIANETVKNYLQKSSKNIMKVIKYSRYLRIYEPMANYFRILL